MTEKRDMKWALELAIASMENPDANWDRRYLAKAADMLRNGGPVVERAETCHEFKCKTCERFPVSAFQHLESINCSQCGSDKIENIKTQKHWAEREKIKIVVRKSKPTYEEIERC